MLISGELIGLEYLLSQSTGAGLKYREAEHSIEEETQADAEELAEDEDEGFAELGNFIDMTIPALETVPALETDTSPVQPAAPARQVLPYYTREETVPALKTDTSPVQPAPPARQLLPYYTREEYEQMERDTGILY